MLSQIPEPVKQRLRPVKRRLGSWLSSGQKYYYARFYGFDSTDLLEMLRRLGIQQGDALLCHVSFDEFRGFRGTAFDVIKVLQEAVGETGTVVMPTIPFAGNAVSYAREGTVTDIRRTPSQMGLITEVFRRTRGVVRSVHPTHSVAAWGAHAEQLTRDHYLAETPCGRGTPYLRLLDVGGKILLLGTTLKTFTFYHGVEELIAPQMPFSPFTQEHFTLQTRDATGQIVSTRTRLYDQQVSSQRDLRILEPELKRSGRWHEARVGGLRSISLDTKHILEACQLLAQRGYYCYRGVYSTKRRFAEYARRQQPNQNDFAHVHSG